MIVRAASSTKKLVARDASSTPLKWMRMVLPFAGRKVKRLLRVRPGIDVAVRSQGRQHRACGVLHRHRQLVVCLGAGLFGLDGQPEGQLAQAVAGMAICWYIVSVCVRP